LAPIPVKISWASASSSPGGRPGPRRTARPKAQRAS
jgi:hypothetical protein